MRILRDRRRKVSSECAAKHIAWLNSHGMGNDSIAACCGVGHATVMKIRHGKSALIYRRTEERILSVTPEGVSDGCRIDSRFTLRLIGDLMAEGWTQRQLAHHLYGGRRTSLSFLNRKKVYARTQLRVEKLYRRAMTEGLSQTA